MWSSSFIFFFLDIYITGNGMQNILKFFISMVAILYVTLKKKEEFLFRWSCHNTWWQYCMFNGNKMKNIFWWPCIVPLHPYCMLDWNRWGIFYEDRCIGPWYGHIVCYIATKWGIFFEDHLQCIDPWWSSCMWNESKIRNLFGRSRIDS